MKKIALLSLLFLLCSWILFIGCDTVEDPATSMGDPPPAISVRSMQELDEMREMMLCRDEAKLEQYLRGVEGGGADNREDLSFFVDLIDSVPYVKFIEGDVSWISYTNNEKAEVLYISLNSPNGDWTRIEYFLSELDVQASIEDRVASQETGETFSPPLQSNDGKIKLYHEMRVPHPSDVGELITWTVDIDGISAKMVFYDSNGEMLYPQTALPSKNVIPFS